MFAEETVDLATFSEEILKRKLLFCAAYEKISAKIYVRKLKKSRNCKCDKKYSFVTVFEN